MLDLNAVCNTYNSGIDKRWWISFICLLLISLDNDWRKTTMFSHCLLLYGVL
jgi:hypothetical protein